MKIITKNNINYMVLHHIDDFINSDIYKYLYSFWSGFNAKNLRKILLELSSSVDYFEIHDDNNEIINLVSISKSDPEPLISITGVKLKECFYKSKLSTYKNQTLLLTNITSDILLFMYMKGFYETK